MSSKRAQRSGARQKGHLTKTMLLPMGKAAVRAQSLNYHLALAACRGGHGNQSLFNELIRATYVAWFLQQMGFGDEPVEQYKGAEDSIEAAFVVAHASGVWQLDEAAVQKFEKILALHDSQLAVAPLYKVRDAESDLRRFLAGTAPSPIP